MKSILIVSAILGMALKSATADGEVGRYQLFVAHVDLSGGTAETLYRIDTATGETCRLIQGNAPISEARRYWFAGAKEFGYEGWEKIPNSTEEALTTAKKAIDSVPEKNSTKP
jgi:hypothetical protein